ncbi:MAG TPA: hypothetical protein DCZ13_04215 [Porticoccaceae bacterium]|nr:hypothetical protein [Porticoccaceae bacterium]
MQALFVRDGDYFIPTETACSPWGPQTLHGGASTALMVAAMEDRFNADEMQLSRLTVDLFHPVPRAPLTVECEAVRDGKRLKVFDASIRHDGLEICRASALVLRKQSVVVPAAVKNEPGLPENIDRARQQAPIEGIGEVPRTRTRTLKSNLSPGLHTVIPLKPVFLDIGVGHGCSWLRLPVPVIEGRDNSPLLQVMALADFANGFSQVHLSEEVGFINADLTVNLYRMPESEWLCIEAEAFPQAAGLSMVATTLYDERGAIGRVSQSNLTMRRYTGAKD